MPRVNVPDGPGPITSRIYELQPQYAEPAARMLEAVTKHSILPVRVRECVRFRIAQINGCLLCQAARSADAAAQGFTEELYTEIAGYASSSSFSEREKLAIRFAELFASDHHRLDDEFFERLRSHFCDPEIVDLAFFAGRYLAFGRLTHVLGLDDSCELQPVVAGATLTSSP